MKLHFTGEVKAVSAGIDALLTELGCIRSDDSDALSVSVHCREGDLKVELADGRASIHYAHLPHFFRGLGLLVEKLQATGLAGPTDLTDLEKVTSEAGQTASFSISEHPQFKTIGPMFDLSRNAVIKLDTFQFVLRKLALMGLNTAMLYMEDVYEIPSQPYFGYMRGRYTKDELRMIDNYAAQFGIEIIPSIQTLAHLEEFLKWDAAKSYRDTRGVLLTDTKDTYDLIDEMIATMKEAFHSKRIHIGMDESEELGRGRHLDSFGYEDRFDIFARHLEKVLGIVKRHGLEPMMWSDMLIKLASGSGEDYYGRTGQLPDEIVNQTPKGVQMVYWDYYHLEQAHYERQIQIHKQFGMTPAFAGGIWIWGTFGANYNFSTVASDSALRACKKEGVDDVYITLWGDDGNESNFLYTLAAMQWYAEHAYHESPSVANIESRAKFITGIDYGHFSNLTYLDETPSTPRDNLYWDNPSKFLLWQDILLGLFDKHIEGLDLSRHYADLEETYRQARLCDGELNFIFEVPEKLCAVLAIKSELGIKTKQAYDSGDIQSLRNIASDVLPELTNHVDDLREAHRAQWMRTFKPFGWEVLDIRYGGVLARIATAQDRLTDYIEGRTLAIEELEAERLVFNKNNPQTGRGLGRTGYYFRAASPNAFFHVLPIAGW